MPKLVISDTSCLIVLDKIGKLDLLQKLYKNVVTTPEIAFEFEKSLPDWVKIETVNDKKYQQILEMQVDLGEASAIALASETDYDVLLLDDLKARKLAKKLNLRFTGTLGVINKAKENGIIENVKPLLYQLQQTNFRISVRIIEEILRLNNE